MIHWVFFVAKRSFQIQSVIIKKKIDQCLRTKNKEKNYGCVDFCSTSNIRNEY